jgi:hypothetical protein
LLQVLTRTRDFLRQEPGADIREWQDWLCDRARREAAGELPGRSFTEFLTFAPEISQFVAEALGKFRADHRVSRLAVEALAWRFGVTVLSVGWCARAERLHPVPLSPHDMQGLILSHRADEPRASSSVAAKTPKKARKHGPDKTPFPKTTPFKIGEEIEQLAASKPRTEARKDVAYKYGLEFDTARRYDQRYIRNRSSKVG